MDGIINQRNALRSMPDDEFERRVGALAAELERCGLDAFVARHAACSREDMMKDWAALLAWDGDGTTTISATRTTGMKILRAFMPHFYRVQNHKGVSVASLWSAPHLEKALRFNRLYHSTPYASEIIRSLSFTNGLGKITMYRPVMAKLVARHFQAKSVLDVCAGWGGRMIGCCAASARYTAFEPCVDTYNGLLRVRDFLGLEGATIINLPAEEALLTLRDDETFDIGLTSPPYFDLELYSNEETQSVCRHATYEDWVDKFLAPVVQGVLRRVRYSCWSVKNFKTKRQHNLLDDVIRLHAEQGWRLVDSVRFATTNSKRPGNSKDQAIKQRSEEATYVFTRH